MTYRCLHGQAPRYLAEHIKPAIEVASRHRLRSANQHRLIVPSCRLSTYGRRAFPVAGQMVWNSLPDELRDPACNIDSFTNYFSKQSFSVSTSVTSALEVNYMRYINSHFTYWLTYLLTKTQACVCVSKTPLIQFARLSHCLGVCPSVRPSVTLVICIKTVQARITKSLLWAAPRSLVYRDKISCYWVHTCCLS